MRLWIDNTSLHSVFRSLTGRARGEEDISGLFQFATQLVFADSIELGCTNGDPVRDTTMEVRDHLLKVGVPADALTVWNLSESTLASACDRAGDRLAAEIDSPISRGDLSPKSIANACPDFKDSNRSGDQAVVRLLMGLPVSLRPARSANHLSEGLSGAPLYILATSDSLWEAVLTNAARSKWSYASAWAFEIYLRCYLNQELAAATAEGTGVFLDYSPSVSRSRIVELQTGTVIDTLSSITDEAAHNINPAITSGSSIAKTLAVRGKYDPTGIIMEALHARAQAQPLRNYLHHVLHTNNVERDYSEIMGTIGRLRSLVDQDVTRCRSTVSEPSLRWQVICFVPVPIPEASSVFRWVNFAMHRRRVAVLSEFARYGANPRLGSDTYRRVLLRATRSGATLPSSLRPD